MCNGGVNCPDAGLCFDPSLLYIATSDFIAHRLRLAVDWKNQDLDRARAVIETHRQVVVGRKARPTLKLGERESPTLTSALILGEEYACRS
ncbi:hypothetical protein NW842_10265 [Synechococcus sp. R55.4]|uniref:hypothetical protein n=1 Tax=unclassified Synechococcus TaxID=2626047 RepID=UPI0039C25834